MRLRSFSFQWRHVCARNHPERSDLIDASIGEGSHFERSFGYYAHGVDASTSVLPEGWEQRLILVSNQNTALARGWCLEVHDLAIAKYSAGREKDIDFTATLARHGLVRMDVLLGRLTVTRLDDDLRARIRAQIERQFSPHGVA